jgi:hypothetical protein
MLLIPKPEHQAFVFFGLFDPPLAPPYEAGRGVSAVVFVNLEIENLKVPFFSLFDPPPAPPYEAGRGVSAVVFVNLKIEN